MLLLESSRVAERRRICRGGLALLRESLCAELQPVIAQPPEIPAAKALLSRAGGRCENDGTLLEFDPFSPRAHRCPTCGAVHLGELHHRAWVTSFQLWLAERCVHASLLHLLEGDDTHAAFASRVLREYAARYARYPNRDNVLGPTRLFFSTYLESIWLLQICVAAGLLNESGDAATADVVRDRIVEPSSALIAGYDEGMSNRQVWNNAALLAAAIFLNDDKLADRVVHGSSGIEAHLSHALLEDGTWYEGENYHLFALRGLWYCVTLCEASGRALPPDLLRRFQSAFVTPFLTALPDFTMPSRKDSQYAVSLRQWWIAELAELGYARDRDQRIAASLARCYEPGHERSSAGRRARSTADVERNGPPSALTRADLGWRALLHAAERLPELPLAVPRSVLLEQQGLAVFRRGDVYAALDYGQSGGGHGHPDRLNVILSAGSTRLLDDMGTGSYVDPSLHWYRSTLAHNAPIVNGRSQPLRDGRLRAYDEREGLGWIVAEFDDREEVRVERAIVVAPDYLVDEVRWNAPDGVRFELPLHFAGDVAGAELEPAELQGGDELEDGFAFVRDVRAAKLAAGRTASLKARSGACVHLNADTEAMLFAASAPGQPATELRQFHLLRARAPAGRFRAVITWAGVEKFAHVEFGSSIVISLANGERHTHVRDADGWHVELFAGSARSSIDLNGWRQERRAIESVRSLPAPPPPQVLRRTDARPVWFEDVDAAGGHASVFTRALGQTSYRRSEESWTGAGSPMADVAIVAGRRSLFIHACVRAGDARFAAADAVNPYDNEHPDTMGAGAQLYARTPDGSGAWTLVPEAGGDHVRVRPIAGWREKTSLAEGLKPPRAHWRRREGGYELRIELSLPLDVPPPEYPVDLDLIVNETTHDRERRRGQLVLSGGHDEFVYLRGDRHDASRLIPLLLVE